MAERYAPALPVSSRFLLTVPLSHLIKGSLPWPEIDADKALPWIEGKTGLTLAKSQAEAIRLALCSKVLVLTGGPGVGKTTIPTLPR